MTFSSLILRKNCREVEDIEADNWNKEKLKLDEAHINIWRFHLPFFRICYLAAKQNTRQNITLNILIVFSCDLKSFTLNFSLLILHFWFTRFSYQPSNVCLRYIHAILPNLRGRKRPRQRPREVSD